MQHHLMAALQEFEVLTTQINLVDIREDRYVHCVTDHRTKRRVS
jgi:hypothetical protein